ncbi:TIGR03067 domain-containing protein [Mucilaginibacter ginsenosidivorans]|uniref:TIGR03067 domain-containing protein n=1 Tax=Mucilaginibacter ginsenosidivorans TaxID=398053 RepID=A0A5B8US08_9SPHI|nr:TIGR03067 domain-containing protein [Mucilaginibacter ginsenosidivorans]QEC61840.1 TIGR03067 domain-containing protein [Mucilaginibacter ginsenosidivorans]
MRAIIFITLVLFGAGYGELRHTSIQSGKLDGAWLPVKEEFGGKTVPPSTFEGQTLVISDSTYTFTAESVDKGVVKYGDGKMDIYGKEGVNTGKHFAAIYKFENDQLAICYNLKGDGYPGAFDTLGKPLYFLCVFKKEVSK